MKHVILFLFSICISLMLHAQVSKTVNVTPPGHLIGALTPTEWSTVTNLKVTGTIDASDFFFMSYNMPLLAELDLSEVKIEYYDDGGNDPEQYWPNSIPRGAFAGKTSVVLI